MAGFNPNYLEPKVETGTLPVSWELFFGYISVISERSPKSRFLKLLVSLRDGKEVDASKVKGVGSERVARNFRRFTKRCAFVTRSKGRCRVDFTSIHS